MTTKSGKKTSLGLIFTYSTYIPIGGEKVLINKEEMN